MKEFCKRGHPLSGDNLVMISKGKDSDKTARGCRTCRELHRALWRDAKVDAQHRARQQMSRRDNDVLERRVDALYDTVCEALDLEVLHGTAGEWVVKQVMKKLIADGYVPAPYEKPGKRHRSVAVHANSSKGPNSAPCKSYMQNSKAENISN